MVRTASVLGVDFARLFRRHGLSEATYNVLRILRGAHGGRGAADLPPPRPCHEIGAMMIAPVPDVTRLIDRLSRQGLATRCRTPDDRRKVLVRITRQGLERLAALDRATLDLHRRQLGHMTRAELSALTRLLEKARHAPAEGGAPRGARRAGRC